MRVALATQPIRIQCNETKKMNLSAPFQHVFSWLRNNLGLVVLMLLVFFIYVPSLKGEFIIDDIPFIRDNPYIRDISHVSRFFTKGVWENSANEISNEPVYRPMNLVPMMLNHALWGNNPFGYHIFLLLLHLANIGLVYALIRKVVAGSATAAMIGAAIFALHPARVESVAWISGGIDPLVAFFLLAAMLGHRSFIDSLKTQSADFETAGHAKQNERRYAWRYFGLSVICFQLALWSKEVAFIFPLVVVAHDLIYRRKIHWPTVLVHALIITGYLIARSLVLTQAGQVSAIDFSHIYRVIDFALGYSEMLVLPTHLPFYIQPPEHAVSSVLGIVSVIVMTMLATFSWRSFNDGQGGLRKKQDFTFSIVWMAGFFWPAILLAFYTDGFYAGRYLYIPSAGLAMLVAIFYDGVTAAYPRLTNPILASCAVLVAFYSFVTWKEIPVWHDAGTIYGRIAQVAPENAVGFLGLGQFHLNRGKYAAAEKDFQLALQKAKTTGLREEALVALGTINGINNNLSQSEAYLQEAIQINPNNSNAWAGLGNLAWIRQRPEEAIIYYEKALSFGPTNYEAALNLALAYDQTGQSQRAEMMRQQAAAMHH
jgi:Tfp pilus assembly protein PilF